MRVASITLFALFLSACPTPPPTTQPADDDDDGTTTPPIEWGADPAVAAGPGEARAGVVRDGGGGLIGGITAEGAPGDLMLWNERARFVVRGAHEGHGYVQSAGVLIDADIVRPEGQLDRDTLEVMFIAFGIGRVFDADSVVVVNDGADGNDAVVLATGRDVLWTFVDGAVEPVEELVPELFLRVEQEFALAPGSAALRTTTRIFAEGNETVRFNLLDGLMTSGEDLWPFVAGYGLQDPGEGDPDAYGVAGKNNEAVLSLWKPDGPLQRFAGQDLFGSAGVTAMSNGWTDVAPGGSMELVRYLAVAPDTATAEAERARTQGTALGLVTGTVSDGESGEPIAGARVHFVLADTVWGYAVSGPDGSYAAELPPGDWTGYVTGDGWGEWMDLPEGAGRYGPFAPPQWNERVLAALSGEPAVPLPFAWGRPSAYEEEAVVVLDGQETSVHLRLGRGGTIAIDLSDATGPRGAIVQLNRTGTPPGVAFSAAMRRRFGLQGGEQPQITAWTADGHLEVPVPPGSWNVEAWTSPRHSRYVQSGVEVIAGETAQVAAEFEEVVPKAGWLSMDSHLHAAPSADGKLPMEDRVIACAAAGVDLPVNTDHDRHADYQPIVAELIRDGQLRWVAGVEVSPVLRGHFNLFPIEPAGRAVPNGGAVAWWERVEDTDELFARMRAVPGPGVSPLVQVNHGRTGMFSFSSYDWTSGAPGRENFFSWDFDAFELVNGQSNGSWEPLRRDWFSFLAVGQKKLPTGVSDSHNRGAECGFARTDIFFGEDDPDAIDPATLRAALTAGHAVVAGGITLRASLDDGTDGPPKLPGDTASADTVTISAQVLGPDWIVPAVVRLYANGELSEELPVGAWDAGTWWGGSWELSPEADTFYVVEVEGNQGIGGPWGGTVAYAATNAFFVDVDGDGWEPPGL